MCWNLIFTLTSLFKTRLQFLYPAFDFSSVLHVCTILLIYIFEINPEYFLKKPEQSRYWGTYTWRNRPPGCSYFFGFEQFEVKFWTLEQYNGEFGIHSALGKTSDIVWCISLAIFGIVKHFFVKSSYIILNIWCNFYRNMSFNYLNTEFPESILRLTNLIYLYVFGIVVLTLFSTEICFGIWNNFIVLLLSQ